MSYDVGTHVSLSHLNKRSAEATFQDAITTQQAIGTSYRFDKNLRAFRIIPVQAI